MSLTRKKYPLSKRKIIKKTISSIIGMQIWFLVVIVIFFILKINLIPISSQLIRWYPLVFLIILVLNYLYQWWYFKTYFYEATEDYLIIRKNPITPYEIIVPWERIQDVYVEQDFLDRVFGLYDVYLSTATLLSGAEAHIDGVEKRTAEGLKMFLLEKVKERVSKSTQTADIK